MRPDFFIVGAPKSGTTAMADYLGAHPEVFLARKEMHFFGSDLRFGPQFFRRDLAAYLAEFEAWKGQRRVGEASVWYLFSTQAAAEIKAFSPEARIIIMLREPVEMSHSLYYYFRYDGNEPLPTFEQALAAEAGRAGGGRPCRQTYFAQGLAYRQVVRYTEQVRRYFDTFGRERVHVILYDDFAADVFAAYRQTLEFLGVEAKGCDPGFETVNQARTVKSPLVRAVMGDPLVRSAAVALRRWVPRPVFAAMQRIDSRVREFNARVEKRPPLGPELRARLKREFAPEVARLSELLGRDLTHWSRDPGAAAGHGALPGWLPQEQPTSSRAPEAAAPPAHRAAQPAVSFNPAPAPVMSVIILNYNGAQWLERCLESLRRQTLFDQIEVIVADNASPDGSVKLAAGLMEGWRNGRTVQHGENLGYSGGNNRAALNARGQYLFFLNTDTWLEPDCLERMMQEMRTSGAIAAAPAIMDYSNGAIQSTSSQGFDIFGLLSSNANRMDPGEIFVAEGCSLLIEREWFRKLGGFDDRLFMYADEYDLCWRVWVTGGRVILAPSARVHHRGAVAVNPVGGERVVEARTSDTKRYYANRNNLVVLLKNSQHLLLVLVPLQLFLLGAEALFMWVWTGRWSHVRRAYAQALADCWHLRPHILAERRRLRGLRQRGDFWMLRFLRGRLNRWRELRRFRRFGMPKVDQK